MAGRRDDLSTERAAFRKTLVQVGPNAPTTCGSWTTTDLAVHVALGELAGAIPNAPFRFLVGRGIRLDRLTSLNKRALERERRRHGFDWAVQRLERDPPRLHSYGAVAVVSLLEVWAHHEDVLDANDVGRCDSSVDLAPVVRMLTRYQRAVLAEHGVRVTSTEAVWFDPANAQVEVRGVVHDLARWLSGRQELDGMDASGDDRAIQALQDTTLRV